MIADSKSSALANGLPASGAVTLRMLLRNVEPLTLARTMVPGNIIRCNTYLSGGAIRGALLTAVRSTRPELTEMLADPKVMSVSNGYVLPSPEGWEAVEAIPSIPDGWETAESIPIPLNIRQPKAGGPSSASGGLTWWTEPSGRGSVFGSRGEKPCSCNGVEPDKTAEGLKYKRIKTEDYLIRFSPGERWLRHPPRTIILMRNRVPTKRLDTKWRSAVGSSIAYREDALFSHEALAEDQYFVADVRVSDSAKAKELLRSLGDHVEGSAEKRAWLRIGRGGKPVVICGLAVAAVASPSTGNNACVPPPDSYLTLTATSDWIIRTPWLTFVTEPHVQTLAEAFRNAANEYGLRQLIPEEGIPCEGFSVTGVWETTEIPGFNRASGLPRSVAVAIRRGGVLEIRCEKPETMKVWRTLVLKLGEAGAWLGDRTAEGFGRFAVDLNVVAPASADSIEPPKLPIPENATETILAKVFRFEESQHHEVGGVKTAQWMTLRNVAAAAQASDDALDTINRLLGQLKDHAQRLSGKGGFSSKFLENLKQQLELVGEVPQSQILFLDSLCRLAVARSRQRARDLKSGRRQEPSAVPASNQPPGNGI